MRISDWSSDVCSSDLSATAGLHESDASTRLLAHAKDERCSGRMSLLHLPIGPVPFVVAHSGVAQQWVLSHGGRVQPPLPKAAAKRRSSTTPSMWRKKAYTNMDGIADRHWGG